VLVKMIAITTSGITIKASERIMSPAVACRVVRATSLSSQSTPTQPVLCSRGALEAGAVVTLRETRYWIARSARGRVFAHRSSDHQRAPTDARRALRSLLARRPWSAYRRPQSIAGPAVRNTVL
jgi:hypothetical protein